MARIEIKVPDLGMSTEGIEFGEWLKVPGDIVTAGEDLFEVEADKATVICEAESEGTLTDIVIDHGDVKTGDIIGYIDA